MDFKRLAKARIFAVLGFAVAAQLGVAAGEWMTYQEYLDKNAAADSAVFSNLPGVPTAPAQNTQNDHEIQGNIRHMPENPVTFAGGSLRPPGFVENIPPPVNEQKRLESSVVQSAPAQPYAGHGAYPQPTTAEEAEAYRQAYEEGYRQYGVNKRKMYHGFFGRPQAYGSDANRR